MITIPALRICTAAGRTIVGPNRIEMESASVCALVGESGSGKTLTLRALAGLPPSGLRVAFSDDPTAKPTLPALAMVFQDPASYFNPRHRIGQALREVLRCVGGLSRSTARRRAVTIAEAVGLCRADLEKFPFEMSGGMLQRSAIALALAAEPVLLLADEITSAMDPELRDRILDLLRHLSRDKGMTILLTSHDLSGVEYIADHIYVLYRGVVVERGPARDVLARPSHHYTDILLRSLPGRNRPGEPLPELPVEDRWTGEVGCPFAGRCPAVRSRCREEEPAWDADRRFRCFYPVTDKGVSR
ncbi:MAG: ABC transporter ATP-binding protein [Spirochaetales bacterium]|nr:ABC transporter ATP-binding protein [Spirochaetales bacterium]